MRITITYSEDGACIIVEVLLPLALLLFLIGTLQTARLVLSGVLRKFHHLANLARVRIAGIAFCGFLGSITHDGGAPRGLAAPAIGPTHPTFIAPFAHNRILAGKLGVVSIVCARFVPLKVVRRVA